MERMTELRGKYMVDYYAVAVTQEMRMQALDFAKRIILSDNQYSRLLPQNVRTSRDVDMKQKIEIQRTYMGKLGELAFLRFLDENGIYINADGMFEIFEGQDNVDSFDFITRNDKTVDVKTGFRNIHKRLLVNVEQFDNLPKDYYVAVKLNAVDVDSRDKLVDWDDISEATIWGYAEYQFMYNYAGIKDFGEGDARWLYYNRLMGIDRLLDEF